MAILLMFFLFLLTIFLSYFFILNPFFIFSGVNLWQSLFCSFFFIVYWILPFIKDSRYTALKLARNLAPLEHFRLLILSFCQLFRYVFVNFLLVFRPFLKCTCCLTIYILLSFLFISDGFLWSPIIHSIRWYNEPYFLRKSTITIQFRVLRFG